MKKAITTQPVHAPVPKQLLIVVEDVGWWSGYDGSRLNRPFRTGMNRRHGPEDYQAIAALGKALGTQVLIGLVLGEWDRENHLETLPGACWPGKGRSLRGIPDTDFQQAAGVLNSNRQHIRIAFHGVSHEFWDRGVLSRTEFHDVHGNMRHSRDIINHLKAFGQLLRGSGIASEFPDIFIPPGLKHSFGNGRSGFQEILRRFGFRFVITRFSRAKQHAPPTHETLTEECGITLLERGKSPVPWNRVAPEPAFSFDWPILPLHWANILHDDPRKNMRVVNKWVGFVKQGAKKKGFVFTENVEESLQQTTWFRAVKHGNQQDWR